MHMHACHDKYLLQSLLLEEKKNHFHDDQDFSLGTMIKKREMLIN